MAAIGFKNYDYALVLAENYPSLIKQYNSHNLSALFKLIKLTTDFQVPLESQPFCSKFMKLFVLLQPETEIQNLNEALLGQVLETPVLLRALRLRACPTDLKYLFANYI